MEASDVEQVRSLSSSRGAPVLEARRDSEAARPAGKRRRLVLEEETAQVAVGTPDFEDVEVRVVFQTMLPRGASLSPGDYAYYQLPADCTEPARLEFKVPQDSYPGDVVRLKATFKIKAHCFRTLRDVTQCSHNDAVQLLKCTLGDPEMAVHNFFDRMARKGN